MDKENDILTKDEIKRAKMCLVNIKDKLRAVESEINKEKAFKYYLKEKLDSITWDINVLNNMVKEEK